VPIRAGGASSRLEVMRSGGITRPCGGIGAGDAVDRCCELRDLGTEGGADGVKLPAKMGLDARQILGERGHTGVDGLELGTGVDDERLERVENLLLVVDEAALVLLGCVGLQELIESP
jgi:hypothetical protein